MKPVVGFESALLAARRLHEQGKHADAERAYRALASDAKGRERVLRCLAELYLQTSRLPQAAEALLRLTEESPDNPVYYWDLASVLISCGDPESAITHYCRLLERRPDFPIGYFNLAILYKRAMRFHDALRAYEKALELGIDNTQEVYTNIGILCSEMHNAPKAREMYERALALDEAYTPASYNLALLCEETGKRQRAKDIYESILAAKPRHWDSLARLGELSTPEDTDDRLVERLREGIEHASEDTLARESLYFALGKVLDGIGRYAEAYEAYRAANSMGERRNPPYDRRATARGFRQLKRSFSAEWIRRNATNSTASPFFICGMFRSGSTLVEQMLGAHPEITAGGELDFLPWLIAKSLTPYPQRVEKTSPRELRALGDEYLSLTHDLFPDAKHLTDKRPDNFLHLGLIKAVFPRARIIYMHRNAADNCLSIYFQQLGGKLSYATDIHNTADYYVRHRELMSHWLSCFRESVFVVEYDELVHAPEPILRELLRFLDLPWDDRCLQFAHSKTLVKTASLWQVRKGLHTASTGRWQNYAALIPGLSTLSEPVPGTGG
jgi:tetratricopeptide (TPR) repeat protein